MCIAIAAYFANIYVLISSHMHFDIFKLTHAAMYEVYISLHIYAYSITLFHYSVHFL